MGHGILSLLAASVFSGGMRKLSAVNELMDRLELMSADNSRKELHTRLRQVIDQSLTGWKSYDYGEGYFYQSYAPLGIRGLRNTEYRYREYGMDELLGADKTVLDIGGNTCFLSLAISKKARHVDSFDINPYLIEIGNICREFEGVENASFTVGTFDDFVPAPGGYDIVLSLANHHTFDGNMRPEFGDYMRKVRDITVDGGLLLFESHPPQIEDHKQLDENIRKVSDLFEVVSMKKTESKVHAFDTNRVVYRMKAV